MVGMRSPAVRSRQDRAAVTRGEHVAARHARRHARISSLISRGSGVPCEQRRVLRCRSRCRARRSRRRPRTRAWRGGPGSSRAVAIGPGTPPIAHHLLLEELLGHAEARPAPARARRRASRSRRRTPSADSVGRAAEATAGSPTGRRPRATSRRPRAAWATTSRPGVVSARRLLERLADLRRRRRRADAPERAGQARQRASSSAPRRSARRRSTSSTTTTSAPAEAQTTPPGKLRLPMAMSAITPDRGR